MFINQKIKLNNESCPQQPIRGAGIKLHVFSAQLIHQQNSINFEAVYLWFSFCTPNRTAEHGFDSARSCEIGLWSCIEIAMAKNLEDEAVAQAGEQWLVTCHAMRVRFIISIWRSSSNHLKRLLQAQGATAFRTGIKHNSYCVYTKACGFGSLNVGKEFVMEQSSIDKIQYCKKLHVRGRY